MLQPHSPSDPSHRISVLVKMGMNPLCLIRVVRRRIDLGALCCTVVKFDLLFLPSNPSLMLSLHLACEFVVQIVTRRLG